MNSIRLLKNGTYSLLTLGVLLCFYQIFKWNIYPWLQLLICFIVPLISLLLSEMIKTPNKEIRTVIFIAAICQLVLALMVITSVDLVQQYWRVVFFPSLFIILVLVYSISLRKEEKYHGLFKILTTIIFVGVAIRFIYYHSYIDYALETIFLIYIILIFRAKSKTDKLSIP